MHNEKQIIRDKVRDLEDDLEDLEDVNENSTESDLDGLAYEVEEELSFSLELDLISKGFEKFLSGPDGGNRPAKSSLQIVQDIKRICTAVGCTNSLENVFTEKTFRDRYLLRILQTKGHCS